MSWSLIQGEMSHIFERLFWVFPDVETLSERANQFVFHMSCFDVQPVGLINARMWWTSHASGLSLHLQKVLFLGCCGAHPCSVIKHLKGHFLTCFYLFKEKYTSKHLATVMEKNWKGCLHLESFPPTLMFSYRSAFRSCSAVVTEMPK